MKRFFVLSMAVLVALSVAGCGSAPASGGATGGVAASSGTGGGSAPVAASSGTASKGLSGVPAFVNEALLNAPEDALVGIGSYTIGNNTSKIGAGKTFAETRARADISRQLNSIVRDMTLDYAAASEIDSDAAVSFQEYVTQTLSKAELKGAKTVKMDIENGVLWVVMEYSKSVAIPEVNQAVNAAKLAVPAAIAFDAAARMDAAFNKEAGGGPVPVGD